MSVLVCMCECACVFRPTTVNERMYVCAGVSRHMRVGESAILTKKLVDTVARKPWMVEEGFLWERCNHTAKSIFQPNCFYRYCIT